jgi:2-polyprenyl-3-methyl-5-hydroxy-6-metoxy-1,4-benzoquinol methylase
LYENRPLTLLDVGCGNAWMWNQFLEVMDNIEYYGFDADRNSVLQARAKLNRFSENIKCADIRSMKEIFPQKFDVIVSRAVIEHVYPRKLFIENVCTALKEHGTILLTCGTSHFNESFITDLRNFLSQILAVIGIEKYYAKEVNQNEMEKIFSEYNMRVVEKKYHHITDIKIIDKSIDDEFSQKVFCLLWGELEDELNKYIQNKDLLYNATGETYYEIVHDANHNKLGVKIY